jgi:uncharacterized protein YciW
VAEKAMLDFAVQLSMDATRLSRDDIAALRGHGFDDRAILQITLIASWFNYINRVADALGVGRDDPLRGAAADTGRRSVDRARRVPDLMNSRSSGRGH